MPILKSSIKMRLTQVVDANLSTIILMQIRGPYLSSDMSLYLMNDAYWSITLSAYAASFHSLLNNVDVWEFVRR
jgi:hypothetical protein